MLISEDIPHLVADDLVIFEYSIVEEIYEMRRVSDAVSSIALVRNMNSRSCSSSKNRFSGQQCLIIMNTFFRFPILFSTYPGVLAKPSSMEEIHTDFQFQNHRVCQD